MRYKMKLNEDINWDKVSFLLKIGIVGAIVILVGDLLMGWGVKDMSLSGIEQQVSQYLTVSDGRMFWSSLLGLIGVPIACVGHFGIYKLLKPYSQKYAKLYAIGILGFLAFAGAGVHVSSVTAAFFYKYMAAVSSETALATSMKFAYYFPLPLYIVLIPCCVIMVYAHIRAVAGGFSPYPRWCWVFSMLVGTLLVSFIGFIGNHAIVNAIMVGAFSFGSAWMLGGHLLMLNKAKENREKTLLVDDENI